MELSDYLRLFRRIWPMLLALTVVGAIAGGAAAALAKPQYQATARAFVTATASSSLNDLTSGASYAQEAASEYAQIATTAYVLRPVIDRLGLQTTPAALAGQVSAAATTGQAVLEVTVTDRSAESAAAIANAVTAQLAKAVVALTPTAGSASTSTSVKLTSVDPAVVPTASTGPKAPMLIAGGGAAGLVIAVLIGLIRELVDTRIRSRDDLSRVTEAPVLGSIMRDDATRHSPLVVAQNPLGRQAESYRTLRTNLRFVQLPPHTRSIAVTSSLEGEGKTTTAANLALAVAGLGERVLLVDADLRRPGVGTVFSVDEAVGLTDVLIGSVTLEQALQHGPSGLDLLPAGTLPPNPNEQLQSAAMSDLVDRLHAEYDLVVFDSPPLLAVSDAVVLSTLAGGTILVAASKTVRRPQVDAALRSLELAGARVVGMVLTMLPPSSEEGARYGYGYGEQHAAAVAAPVARVSSGRASVR